MPGREKDGTKAGDFKVDPDDFEKHQRDRDRDTQKIGDVANPESFVDTPVAGGDSGVEKVGRE